MEEVIRLKLSWGCEYIFLQLVDCFRYFRTACNVFEKALRFIGEAEHFIRSHVHTCFCQSVSPVLCVICLKKLYIR